jgi:hypothetical protein
MPLIIEARVETMSPLCEALPKRVTAELEYLQVRWAAHLPYAAATALLKEVLPLEHSISTTGTRNRIRTTGQDLDARIEREIAALPEASPAEEACESAQVTAISVDSAWLKHCAPPRSTGRQVNIVAGRATLHTLAYPISGRLWRALSQGAAHQQQHRRVGR